MPKVLYAGKNVAHSGSCGKTCEIFRRAPEGRYRGLACTTPVQQSFPTRAAHVSPLPGLSVHDRRGFPPPPQWATLFRSFGTRKTQLADYPIFRTPLRTIDRRCTRRYPASVHSKWRPPRNARPALPAPCNRPSDCCIPRDTERRELLSVDCSSLANPGAPLQLPAGDPRKGRNRCGPSLLPSPCFSFPAD